MRVLQQPLSLAQHALVGVDPDAGEGAGLGRACNHRLYIRGFNCGAALATGCYPRAH
jgi:hypothetical protein